MKIAVIGDLHLPYIKGTPQWDFWDWAKNNIIEKEPDAVVVIGDISADGNAEVVGCFLQDMKKLPGEKLIIRGNSDLRSDGKKIKKMLSNYAVKTISGWNLIAMDEGDGSLLKEDFLDCGDRVLLFTHHDFSEEITYTDNLKLYVFGHIHKNTYVRKNKTEIYSINGCDPDKTIGAAPQIAYFEVSESEITVSKETWEEAGACQWTKEEKEKLIHLMGISCYKAIEDIEFAAEKRLACVELRPNAVEEDRNTLQSCVQHWRNICGEYLSVHMPDIGYDGESLIGVEEWIKSIELVRDVKADGLTIHVPKTSVLNMQSGGKECISDFLKEMLSKLPNTIKIGIENMHMTEGEATDDRRRFGYLPAECIEWAAYLSKVCGREIKLHLDVGHARNNRPFSEPYTLGVWYTLLGTDINAYHIHQTSNDNGVFHNHQPIGGIYEELISYGSFLQSWKQGRISHSPMFVEVKNPKKAYAGIEAFKNALEI